MGIIMINCPATGHGVSTGIEVCATDQLPIVVATTVCPACGRVHEWTKNEAWLVSGGDQYRCEDRKRAGPLSGGLGRPEGASGAQAAIQSHLGAESGTIPDLPRFASRSVPSGHG